MKLIFTLLLISFCNTCFSQVDLTLGLRAYYPFTGNANDASGNGNNAIFNNATLTPDRLGAPNSAYHFNGTSSYIQIANSASLNTVSQLTLCAWVRPQAFYTGTCHGNSILLKGNVEYATGNYIMRFDDGAYTGTSCSGPVDPAHETFYGNSDATPVYTPYIIPNSWTSVVYTYDGTTIKLYVDCILKRTTVLPGMTFTNTAPLYLGSTPYPAYPYWFTGDMDEIRIYDRVLNLNEIETYGGCKLIPVTLLSFNAYSAGNKNIHIYWSATNEDPGNYFVERAEKNSNAFSVINTQPMAGGTGINNYFYDDQTAVPGIVYQYRLRTVENTRTTLSAIKLASLHGSAIYAEVQPNPSSGVFRVNISGVKGSADMAVYDATGRMVYEGQQDLNTGLAINIDLTGKPAGLYILKIQTEQGSISDRLIIK